MKIRPLALAALCLLAATPALSSEPEQQRRACQSLKNAIDNYTDKRRAGGSPAQMDAWKRARQDKKNDWDRLKCRKIRRQLD